MNTRTLILAILSESDATGYEIKKLSSEGRFSYFIDVSFGSIYPTLSKLEADELVTCRQESQAGKPDRKIYSITDAGRYEFVKILSNPPQADKFKSEFLLLAMSAPLVSQAIMANAIEDRIQRLKQDLEMIDHARNECGQGTTKWVTRYGETMMRTDMKYLTEHADELLALCRDGGVAEAAE